MAWDSGFCVETMAGPAEHWHRREADSGGRRLTFGAHKRREWGIAAMYGRENHDHWSIDLAIGRMADHRARWRTCCIRRVCYQERSNRDGEEGRGPYQGAGTGQGLRGIHQ